MRVSVVIPTYCEADQIGQAVRSAAEVADEVIVVDGCSSDGTACQAVAAGAQIVLTRRGRGAQMHAGARRASGDVVVFLQADVRLPTAARAAIEEALEDPNVDGGHFRLRFEPCRGWARFFSWASHVRRRWMRGSQGESAMFIRRSAYLMLGGSRPTPWMEGFELMRRLQHATHTVYVSGVQVPASARRFEHAPVRTLAQWTLVQGMFMLGLPPSRLARLGG
jgi:glycosyltransferase involved in cell wall biosynthesis